MRGVQVEPTGVAFQFACGVLQLGQRASVALSQRGGGWVELFQFPKEPGQFRKARQQSVIGIGQSAGDLGGKLHKTAAVGDDVVPGNERSFLVLAQGGGFDLARLVTQQIQLAFERRFAAGKLRVFGDERIQIAIKRFVFVP